MRLFVYGGGYSALVLARRVIAAGGTASLTSRDPSRRWTYAAEGLEAVDPADVAALDRCLASANAVLVTAPPTPAGCPGLAALAPGLRAHGGPRFWIGYLSTTGVYGDREGGWVLESSALAARSTEAVRRVRAETDWRGFGRGDPEATVAVFRLPGLYGPGRSPIDRVRQGRATRTTRPGQVFSRLHVDDLAEALLASIARPRRDAVYNLCDDLPAPPADVTAEAYRLLGLPCPPERPFDPGVLSPTAQRFWGESKRVGNALAKAELGWLPRYPTYREGMASILAAEAAASSAPKGLAP